MRQPIVSGELLDLADLRRPRRPRPPADHLPAPDADITVQDIRRCITLARDAIGRLPALAGGRTYDNYLMFLPGGPKIATR